MTRLLARGRSGASVIVDASVSRVWRLASAGQVGEARVTLPYRQDGAPNPAARADIIDPNGGAWLTVFSERGCGDWHGVAGPITFDAMGATLTAYQPWRVLGQRRVSRRAFANVNAGLIVGAALRDALPGVRGLWLGAAYWDGDGVVVRRYAFDRQDAWSVARDMMAAGGGRLWIDAVTGRVDWAGPLALARRYPATLVAYGAIEDLAHTIDPSVARASVMAANAGDAWEARNALAAYRGWPAQETLTSDRGSQSLSRAAGDRLATGLAPGETLTGSVGPEHFGLREGDIVSIIAPGSRWTGVTLAAQVIERSLDTGGARMSIVWSIVEPNVAEIAALPAGRVPDARRLAGRFVEYRRAISTLERRSGGG